MSKLFNLGENGDQKAAEEGKLQLPVFKPLKETEKKPVRFWPGQAPGVPGLDATDVAPPLAAARSAGLPAEVANTLHPATSVPHVRGNRGRDVVEAEIVMGASAAAAPAPLGVTAGAEGGGRRRIVEAAVIEEPSHGTLPAGQAEVGHAERGTNAEEEDPEERRRRIRSKLTNRRRSPSVEEGETVHADRLDSLLPSREELSSTGRSRRVAAEAEVVANGAVPSPATRAAGETSPSTQRLTARPSEGEDMDPEERRRRIRERQLQREQEGSREAVHQQQQQQSRSPGSALDEAAVEDGGTARGRRRLVEATVIGTEAADSSKQSRMSPEEKEGPDRSRQRREEHQAMALEEQKGDAEDEEDEDDEEDDFASRRPVLFRPVFRSKEQRDTIAEAERLAAEEEAERQRVAAAAAKRVEESRSLVASELAREQAAEEAAQEDADLRDKPDDTDRPEEEEAELEAWKLREMRRMVREMEAGQAAEAEAAETLRRRNLTDEERAIEDRELEKQGLKVFVKQKREWKFMQRYYHKGAFYMDEDSLKAMGDPRKKAEDVAGGATGEDVYDKSALPAIMQVKGFGMKGRTKWTHLAAEDTTAKDDFHREAQKFASRQFYKVAGGLHGDRSVAAAAAGAAAGGAFGGSGSRGYGSSGGFSSDSRGRQGEGDRESGYKRYREDRERENRGRD